jgi:hypothetical protein
MLSTAPPTGSGSSVRMFVRIIALKPDWHSDDVDKGKIKAAYTRDPTDEPVLALEPVVQSNQMAVGVVGLDAAHGRVMVSRSISQILSHARSMAYARYVASTLHPASGFRGNLMNFACNRRIGCAVIKGVRDRVRAIAE